MQFGRSLTVRGAAPSFDAATLAWVAAVFAVDSTVVSTPRKTLVDNLIVGLKADGIWTKLDRLWLFAMENSTEALVDIVAASLATAVNSPIFTPDNGYTGDVNTFRYINTNWNPATEGVSYTLNSASMTVWSNTSRAVASGRFVLGADKAGDQALVSFFSTSGLTSIRLNTVAGGGAIASPTSLGLFTANRSLASAQQWYQDGASIGTNALSSGTVPSDDIFLLVLNSSGSPGSPDDIQISCAAFGGSLDATNNANLYSRLLTYMNAVGIQTSGFDTDTSAWVAAVVANGGSVSYARMALVDALITGLKDDGVWTKLDRLWLFAAENEFAAEVDLVADAVATPNVSPTFTPDEGYAGNGSTSYVDSGYNPTTNGTNFTLNSAHMSAWVTDAAYSGAGATTGVVGGGTAYSRLIPKFGTSTLVEVNEGGDEVESTRIADGVPHLLASRTASNSVTLYYDGAVSAHSPFANASGALPNFNFFICATNNVGGGAIDPTASNIAMVSYGGLLSATDAANLYSRLLTYMIAVGVTTDDVDVNNWSDAVMANGGTISSARRLLVYDLVTGLKDDGVWTKLDRLWLFAMENSTEALVDIVADSLATAVSSPTFAPDIGYMGNGSTSYVDTNFNPATMGVDWQLNSASISIWNSTDRASNANYQAGASDASAFAGAISVFNSTNFNFALNSSGFVAYGTTTSSLGLFTGVRSSSSATAGYWNGGLTASRSDINSTAVASFDFFVLGTDSNGTFGSGTTDQISAAVFGGGLNATEAGNLYSRLLTYMTAVGAVGGFDTDTDAWIAAVVANGGGVSRSRALLVDALITGLKNDGVWTKLDRLWLFAAENQDAAQVDLVADAILTENSSPTFTTDRGYTGNGSSSYIDSNFNPTVGGPNYTQNNATAFGWQITSGQDGAALVGNNSVTVLLSQRESDDKGSWRLNDVGSQRPNCLDSSGLWSVSRNAASGAGSSVVYQNGSSFFPFNTTSAAVSNEELWFLRVTSIYSAQQIACGGFGANLDATESANLYSRLRTYMTAVGVP